MYFLHWSHETFCILRSGPRQIPSFIVWDACHAQRNKRTHLFWLTQIQVSGISGGWKGFIKKTDEIKSQPSHLWPLQQFKSRPIVTNDERLVRWATSVLHTLYNPTSTTTVHRRCKKKILFQSFFYAKSQWHLVFINTVRNLSAPPFFFFFNISVHLFLFFYPSHPWYNCSWSDFSNRHSPFVVGVKWVQMSWKSGNGTCLTIFIVY